MMENPRNIEFCAHLLFCAKNVERIARALHHSGSLLHCARATLLEETAEGGLDQQQGIGVAS
jgi:phosphate transport system protein